MKHGLAFSARVLVFVTGGNETPDWVTRGKTTGMNGQQLRHALKAGQNVFGTLVVANSPRWPQAIKLAGLDFIFIDTEHTSLDRDQVAWMCQTYSNMGLAPLVRIPSPDPYVASNALDTGAEGIIMPYIESVDEVKQLRGALRFRPLKGQRLAARLDGEMLEPELESYLEHRNRSYVMIINIESVPAMEALDEILAVPGIDAVLIGPHDLSCSLGIPEEYDNPRFLEAVGSIFQRARQHGVGAGIHFTGEPEAQARFIQAGANMIIHCADISLFAKQITSDLSAIRERAGLSPTTEEDVSDLHI